ncbi:MAG: DUF4157 domain-containing protein [Myxococcales bacterium]|nr:DUF4157 domain-containing protein [Myxococcales bacterium]
MRQPKKSNNDKRQSRSRNQSVREAPEKGDDRPQRGKSRAGLGTSIALMARGLAASDPAVVTTTARRILAQFGQAGRQQVLESLSAPRSESFERLARQALATLRQESGTKALPTAALGALQRLSTYDPSPDGARAMREATDALIARLAPALGLPGAGVPVRFDDAATARVQSRGARAVFESGAIYIDQTRFEPTTRDGAALLAHELTHAAQARFGAETAGGARGAELEAATAAFDVTQGHLPSRPTAALPSGYVAREGGEGINLQEIQRLREQLQGQLGPAKEQIQSKTPPTSPEGRMEKPIEDPSEKVDRYEGGVDGIADEIGDLDAFDTLIDAIDEEEPTEPAMGRIRKTESYQQLCDMWQGALEGNAQKSQMVRAFESQFEGRGFWGETETAFGMICRQAKRDAKLNAEAKAAKAELANAQGKDMAALGELAQDPKTTPTPGEAPKAAAPKSARDKAMEKAMAMKVDSAEPEKLTSFVEAEKMHGGQQGSTSLFSEVSKEYGHYQSHAGAAKKVAEEGHLGRSGQIWSEAFKGLAGGGTKGFVDQFLDTMVLDTLGSLGDLALKSATKGVLGSKVPVIGPAIQLFQSGLVGDVFSGEIFSGRGKFLDGLNKNAGKIGEEFSASGKNFGRMWDAGLSVDGVGFMCAGIADLVSGVSNVLDMVAQVLGVLSALSYIVGAILICVGLALIWLGFGAGLISAGGWLVKAGTVLGKVVTALGPIVIALKAVAALFRIAAAYMVPADAYAEQLAGVGKNAESFGEKAGARAADKTAGKVKAKIAGGNKKESPKKDPAAEKTGQDGVVTGDADGKARQQDLADADAAAVKVKETAEQKKAEHDEHNAADDKAKKTEKDEAARAKQESDEKAAKAKEDEAAAAKATETPKSGATKRKQAWRAAKDLFMGDFVTSVKDIGSAAKDLAGMTFNAQKRREAAAEILINVAPGSLLKHKERLEALKAARDELQRTLEEADKKATDAVALHERAEAALREAEKAGHDPNDAASVADHQTKLRDASANAAAALRGAEAAKAEFDATTLLFEKIDAKVTKREGKVADLDTRITGREEVFGPGLESKNDRAKKMDPVEREQLQKAKADTEDAAVEARAKAKQAGDAHESAAKAKGAAETEATTAKTAHDEAVARKVAVDAEAAKLKTAAEDAATKARELRDQARAEKDAARALEEGVKKARRDTEALTRKQTELLGEATTLRDRVAKSIESEAALPEARALETAHDSKAREHRKARSAADSASWDQATKVREIARKTDGLRDQPIEVGVGPDGQPVKATYLSASEDGVRVRDGGPGSPSRVVPWDQITGPSSLVDASASIKAASTERDRLKAVAEQAQKDADAAQEAANAARNQVYGHEHNIGSARPGDRDRIITEAQAKESQANGEVAVQLDAAKQVLNKPIAGDLASHEARATALQEQAAAVKASEATLREQLRAKKGDAAALEMEIEAKKRQHTVLESKANEARGKAAEAKKAMDAATTARTGAEGRASAAKDAHAKDEDAEELYGTHQTLGNAREEQSFWKRMWSNPSSGNAMGGVGSAYKDLLANLASGQLFQAYLGIVDRAAHNENAAAGAAAEKAAENPAVKAQRETLLQTDSQREAEEEKKKREQSWAAQAAGIWSELGANASKKVVGGLGGPLLGDLLLEAPPKDPVEMGATFARAQAAMEASVDNHVKAYEAFVAEEHVGALIADEEKLQKEVGDRVKADTDAQKAPIADGKKKEKERKSKVKEKEAKDKAQMDNALIGGLAEKVMKNAKYLSTSPNPEVMRTAGSKSGNAQDEAKETTENATATSVDSSEKQATFLEGLEASQGKIVDYVKANQDKLATKIDEDKAQKTEIQKHKAEFIITSRQKRMEADQESLRFMVDMNDAVAWAAKYKQKRVAAGG